MKTVLIFLLLLVGLSVEAQIKSIPYHGRFSIQNATISTMYALKINVPEGQTIKSTLYRIEFDWCVIEKIAMSGKKFCETGPLDKFYEVGILYANGAWAHLSIEQLKLIYYAH